MRPMLTLEMVERDGRVCYVDPSGKEVYVVSADVYERLRPHLSEPMQPPWVRCAVCGEVVGHGHEHVWSAAQVVKGTHLARRFCTVEGCGAVSYGHGGEG